VFCQQNHLFFNLLYTLYIACDSCKSHSRK
jgi:hypothetical protein